MEYWHRCLRICFTVPRREKWISIWKEANANWSTAATVTRTSRYRLRWGGEVTINTPRDRDGTFDPQIERKREKILADRIIGMYAIGSSTR